MLHASLIGNDKNVYVYSSRTYEFYVCTLTIAFKLRQPSSISYHWVFSHWYLTLPLVWPSSDVINLSATFGSPILSKVPQSCRKAIGEQVISVSINFCARELRGRTSTAVCSLMLNVNVDRRWSLNWQSLFSLSRFFNRMSSCLCVSKIRGCWWLRLPSSNKVNSLTG